MSDRSDPRENQGPGGQGSERDSRQQAARAQQSNAKLGLRLFAIYALFYASYVFVNAFAAQWSDWRPFGGLNLAVLWGFSLIFLAFLLALLYGVTCQSENGRAPRGGQEKGKAQ